MGAVRAGLRWQSKIDVAGLAKEAGLAAPAVEWALAQCAASGLVGYDLADRVYFHRELPFDLTLITRLQPRLADARKLVAEDAVHIESGTQPLTAWVRSRGLEYRVVLGDGAGQLRLSLVREAWRIPRPLQAPARGSHYGRGRR